MYRLRQATSIVNMGNKTIILIYLGIAIFLGYSLVSNVRLFFKARQTIAAVQFELEKEQIRNTELQKKQVELGKAIYIERVARDTLGLGKEGEIALVMPQESEVKKLSPRLFAKKQETDEKENTPVWKQWLQLFI